MGYQELVERKFTVLAEEAFGDYQGDYVFLVEGSGGLGVIIAGYGSCSGCDAYEATGGYDLEDGETNSELDELAGDLHRSVKYGTVEELREYLVGEDAALRWYYHESGFAEAIDRLFSHV